MRSDQQLDLYKHSPNRLAEVYRQAAETEAVNPYYPPALRKIRHDHFAAIAERLERSAEAQNG